ncbi:MAG TPA: TolC family protein [Gemmatimonadaceae bacterium]
MQRLAVRQNPTFLAARQETDIARGALRQAGIYQFNPELGLVAPGGAGGAASPYELTLSQVVEWAGQRGLRVDAARHGVTRATSVVRDAARVTVASASAAFYRALASQQRLRLAEEVFALNERLVRAVRTQLAEGEISALEGNLAEIEFGRARARVLAARRASATAELALKRELGVDPATPVRLSDDMTAPLPSGVAPDSLVTLALARRPDLAARVAATRQAATLASLARREGIPNLRVGAVGEQDRDGGNSRVGLTVGLGVPLFNRNQGLVAQRQAEARRSALELAATELGVRTDVRDAANAYRAASDEAAVFEASVLEPARRNMPLLEEAYRAGKVPLPTLLLLRNQLLDAELGYWDAWLARREALVALQAATGAPAPALGDATDTSGRTTR